ncbi:hypothetical protein ACG873_13145 [Mesorhizobium sp. AaZ16]|uniref:hypothetical protein n=1 Tax=Mesorhizobium sp. AaZ16 TaxID=3402289 RepID=UPI00374EBFD2
MSDEPPRVIMIAEIVEPVELRKIEDHWCEHPACKKWGSFGFADRYRTDWL